MDLEAMMKEIKNIPYIKKQPEQKQERQERPHESSLKYIINRELTQSQSIRLGHAVEHAARHYPLKINKDLIDIKQPNKKGKKEKDILFINHKKKKVYYTEIKTNLNLDTEKSKITSTKCQEIVENLKSQYKGYKVEWCLFGARYIDSNQIPKSIKNRYSKIQENLGGVNDYLEMLDIKDNFSEERYHIFVNGIEQTMF
jgi:hypothetical protein